LQLYFTAWFLWLLEVDEENVSGVFVVVVRRGRRTKPEEIDVSVASPARREPSGLLSKILVGGMEMVTCVVAALLCYVVLLFAPTWLFQCCHSLPQRLFSPTLSTPRHVFVPVYHRASNQEQGLSKDDTDGKEHGPVSYLGGNRTSRIHRGG
jgi:hypothetical protein